jgi:hypothetical protein
MCSSWPLQRKSISWGDEVVENVFVAERGNAGWSWAGSMLRTRRRHCMLRLTIRIAKVRNEYVVRSTWLLSLLGVGTVRLIWSSTRPEGRCENVEFLITFDEGDVMTELWMRRSCHVLNCARTKSRGSQPCRRSVCRMNTREDYKIKMNRKNNKKWGNQRWENLVQDIRTVHQKNFTRDTSALKI